MPERDLLSLTRSLQWHRASEGADALLGREWIVANGLGGYASSSVAGVPTRRYHGLLIAALPAPLGRVVMLNHSTECFTLADGSTVQVGGEEYASQSLEVPGHEQLESFALELGVPVWRYRLGDALVEKRLLLLHGQNTVHLTYRLAEGAAPVRVQVRPSLGFRGHESSVDASDALGYGLTITGDRYEVAETGGSFPPLRLLLRGERASLTVDRETYRQVFYRVEAERGYPAIGSLWSPGYFEADLAPNGEVALIASTESWDVLGALEPGAGRNADAIRRQRLVLAAPPPVQDALGAQLVLAADQFLIAPAGRIEDVARARAAGDQVRTVIAGYHWFTDWGRDTMISLEGLTLATGRAVEAGYVLRTFARYVRRGLIPNLFPEGNTAGLYHTADATPWFFHALNRYLRATDDWQTLRRLLPTLLDIVDWHLKGTDFGIGVDPEDGLLRQGQEGVQLTWMDAKVDDWVVTPRRGKAVEINALWFNALRLLEGWLRHEGDESGRADEIASHAQRAQDSFNRRFWNDTTGYLYDVVDGEAGDDPACRPNQVFAISLDHPVLAPERWAAVMEAVETQLLTPVGLRSLAPGHPDYKPSYTGDLRSRDAAYHQGTVWAWLIGPYIDAYLRVHPGHEQEARARLDGFHAHLGQAGLGTISEVFDAEPPYTPRGCIAQAWSVAEVLRAWAKTAPPPTPAGGTP